MIRRNGGIVLTVSGLAAVQGVGLLYFGPAFWPAVLVLAGGVLAWAGFIKNTNTGNNRTGDGAEPDLDAVNTDLFKAKARAEAEILPLKLL